MSEPKIRTMVVTGYWNEGNTSKIPDEVRFGNASENYLVTIKQPRPQVMETIRLIQIMKNNIYGGSKKTGDAATSTGQRTKNTVVSIPQKGKLNNESSL